jgi:hypothetical protein
MIGVHNRWVGHRNPSEISAGDREIRQGRGRRAIALHNGAVISLRPGGSCQGRLSRREATDGDGLAQRSGTDRAVERAGTDVNGPPVSDREKGLGDAGTGTRRRAVLGVVPAVGGCGDIDVVRNRRTTKVGYLPRPRPRAAVIPAVCMMRTVVSRTIRTLPGQLYVRSFPSASSVKSVGALVPDTRTPSARVRLPQIGLNQVLALPVE